eukprot:CAMPEP_0168570944 /NCGR_PEP_ID=MMETSP0413-20121227/17039_1 /TAXON_ID=136452 /ORGANISM="Filamoeba nolandi, Strain NC-AS-23-1" /LENGTH=232 /DNA_ID=CAMNT_0008603697 /DNA_START=56 /DNA_END=752 /DNA_ORIENTATION=-
MDWTGKSPMESEEELPESKCKRRDKEINQLLESKNKIPRKRLANKDLKDFVLSGGEKEERNRNNCLSCWKFDFPLHLLLDEKNILPGTKKCASNMTPQIKDYKKDVVYLFQFPLLPGGKNSSPFCLKLEAYLQKNGIPYEVVKGDHYNKNPKQKLPAIEFNGEAMSDSTFIIQYLKTKFGDPDRTLSSSDAAITTAFQRLIEDHLYYAIVYFRWIHSSSWPQWSVQAFRGVP